jgi:hypothetical protein
MELASIFIGLVCRAQPEFPKNKANGINSDHRRVLFPVASGQHEDVQVHKPQDAKKTESQFDSNFNPVAHAVNFKHFAGWSGGTTFQAADEEKALQMLELQGWGHVCMFDHKKIPATAVAGIMLL